MCERSCVGSWRYAPREPHLARNRPVPDLMNKVQTTSLESGPDRIEGGSDHEPHEPPNRDTEYNSPRRTEVVIAKGFRMGCRFLLELGSVSRTEPAPRPFGRRAVCRSQVVSESLNGVEGGANAGRIRSAQHWAFLSHVIVSNHQRGVSR
jgi:hypothetical protein